MNIFYVLWRYILVAGINNRFVYEGVARIVDFDGTIATYEDARTRTAALIQAEIEERWQKNKKLKLDGGIWMADTDIRSALMVDFGTYPIDTSLRFDVPDSTHNIS